MRCREEKRIDQDRRDTFRLDIDRCTQCWPVRTQTSQLDIFRTARFLPSRGWQTCLQDKDHSRSFFRSRMDQHNVQHCKRCMPKGRCSLRARQTCQRRTPYNWFAQPRTGTSHSRRQRSIFSPQCFDRNLLDKLCNLAARSGPGMFREGTTVCRHTKRSSQYTVLCCPTS